MASTQVLSFSEAISRLTAPDRDEGSGVCAAGVCLLSAWTGHQVTNTVL